MVRVLKTQTVQSIGYILEFIFSFAGKTELSCKIIDADDEWIKICYTEKKDKQVVKLMRIENIESIEEQ